MQTMLFLYLKIHRDANAVVAGRKSWSNVPILSAGWVALGRLPVEPSQILSLIWIHVLRTTVRPVCLFHILKSPYNHPDIDTPLLH